MKQEIKTTEAIFPMPVGDQDNRSDFSDAGTYDIDIQ